MTQANPSSPSPAELDKLYQQAVEHHQAGRLAEADAGYRQLLALQPKIAEAHNNLGILLARRGQFAEAATRFETAIALQPDYADAHSGLAFVLTRTGQLAAATAHYERALALKPHDAELYNNLGNVFLQRNRLAEAAGLFEQAIGLNPRFVGAHNNLAKVLRRQRRFDEAAASSERALALDPNYAEAHANLGNVLMLQGKFEESVARFAQALAIKPNLADAHNNLGNVLLCQDKLDEAAASYRRALAIQPDLAKAQMGLAVCALLAGDYQSGWPAYEARLRLPEAERQPNLPRWQGEPLEGRRLLLWAEQGLGDTLQFVRYARLFKQRGARVVLAVAPALGRLLAPAGDWDEVVLKVPGEQLPACDFYLPVLSAPLALGTDAATIPAKIPYLAADPALTDRWRQELAKIEGCKIGISWQGERSYAWDPLRSIPLSAFAPLARVPGVRLISLQKGFGAEQIATVDFPIIDFSGQLDEAAGPFMDTAALIKNLDLVVTSDTAIPHLAGALGTPVFLALGTSADWRWLRRREDSPWYPTMRLFRQTSPGQWSDVFQRIASAVEQSR